MRILVVAGGLVACAQGGEKAGPRDAPEQFGSDAPAPRDARVDARLVDASCPQAMPAGPHLLLSEVAMTPAGHEFIEIVNPTASAVDLTHYYLSDSGAYYKLPAGAPNLGASDFIVKFPANAMIAAHSVITVATDTAANFMAAYGSMPTYSITDGSITSVAANSTPTLTDAGEMVVLFYWDGSTALVFDVDLLLAGVPTAANSIDPARSGYAQLGCTYATDADTIAAQTNAPGSGKSTKRLALETGHETQTGGNGITGDDETSEDTSATWDHTTATFTAPTPGMVPAAIM
jgi:hypothetical protein